MRQRAGATRLSSSVWVPPHSEAAQLNSFANLDEFGLRRGHEGFTLKSGVRGGALCATREMEHFVMRTSLKMIVTLGMAIGATVFLQTQSATAISADLAKKCRDLAIKAHPYTEPLMKAGNAEGQRAYFKDCVAKGGNMSADPHSPDPKRAEPGKPGNIGPN
jgi:hypothetical protein